MFDNLCKFLVENFSDDFATWLLGEPVTLTELSPKELSLEPIRADALILRQSEELILHVEFQTQPDVKIPFRMADYRGSIPILQIYQNLIVIANEALAKRLPQGDSGMKQSQSLTVAIASLHFITLAMTNYIFPHLGCSRLSFTSISTFSKQTNASSGNLS